jgi:phospholipase C
VVSPWARANHVTSVVHDHTSILAMVERKWNLPAMTHRDAAAADLSDFLDLGQPAFAEPPTLAQPLAGPAQLACEKTGPGQVPPPGSVTPR